MSGSADVSQQSVSISELPIDELRGYGRELGLTLSDGLTSPELVQIITDHQNLVSRLDREAMLDVIRWMRWPVRSSAGKESLAKIIIRNKSMDLDSLSDRGLVVLALLRGLSVQPTDNRNILIKRIYKSETWADRARRKRAQLTAKLVSKLIPGINEEPGEYRFLPDDHSESPMHRHLDVTGVVGGLTRRLRGVADDYVREKMDEIESRIDKKLEQIDQRLGEWRDREIAHRLKIFKITLFVSILVALLSIGYHYFVRIT